MTFPPGAGAGPGENQITQNTKGFWSSLFLIYFLVISEKQGFGFDRNDTSFYNNTHKVI